MKKTMCIILLFLSAILLVSCEINENTTNPSENSFNFSHQSDNPNISNGDAQQPSKLCAVKTSPYKISVEKVFETLTQKNLDDSYQKIKQVIPEGGGKSDSVLKGEKPLYDLQLCVETISTGTNIYYCNDRYNYINTVFYINDNRDSLTKEALPFATVQDAMAKITRLLAEYDTEADILECYTLSRDTLQKLYDTRKASGTLRDERYGTGNSPVKNQSAVAEKSVWSESDACYYIEGNISLQGVPVFGGKIEAVIDSTGIVMFSVTGLIKTEAEEEKASVLSREEIILRLNDISQNIYSENEITLTDLSIYFYPVKEGCYKPLWIANLEYTFTNPDNVKEIRNAEIMLDAITGKEVSFGG